MCMSVCVCVFFFLFVCVRVICIMDVYENRKIWPNGERENEKCAERDRE